MLFIMSRDEAGTNPACLQARGGVHLGQVANLSQRPTAIHTYVHTCEQFRGGNPSWCLLKYNFNVSGREGLSSRVSEKAWCVPQPVLL